MQTFHSDLLDIPWNFLVGDDGNVYEGRGFRFQGELLGNESASSFNDIGIIIAFIGTFIERQPSQRQAETFNAFLESSVRRDLVKKDFKLFVEDSLVKSEESMVGLRKFLKDFEEFYLRKIKL